jgi:tetratricopeptide (TPR) repeat protein
MRLAALLPPESLPLAVAAAMALAPTLAAQEHEHHHDAARLGRVVFPVSCTPAAQQRFEHAMAVLHSFWWEEGDNAFRDVLAADSTCAMAWWGLALNAWGNPFAGGPTGPARAAGTEAAARASALPAQTRREGGFIAAVGALYRDAPSTPNSARLQAYADTMARLYRAFPRDVEVAIYHALAQLATAPRTDTTFAQQRRAIAILEPLFARHPDHPGIAHYVIHATDSPRLAHLGLRAARRYAQIAPAAPHAQHMPSHIFVRLGLWDETVASNWKSYRAGSEYAKAAGLPSGTPEELHALDYAVYGYLQRGEDSAARAAVAVGDRVTASNARGLVASYNRTAMAARIPLERGDWSTAATFPLPPDSLAPIASALARFTRALGSARSGRVEPARVEVGALDSIATVLEAKGEPYWSRVVRIKRDAADAWTRLAAGDTARALALAKAAADAEEVTDKHQVTPGELLPARELEGDMLLAMGRPAEARVAYRQTLAREPGRARSIFGAARSAELSGDRGAAGEGYRELLRLMAKADPGRAEVATAKAFGGMTTSR